MLPRTLTDAVEMALSNRTELGIAKAQVSGAQAKVKESRGAFLPTVDLFSDARHTKSYDTFSGIDVSATVNGQPLNATITRSVPTYQVTSGTELGLNIYSGGLTTARISEASAQERVARAQKALAQREVVLDIAETYWSLKRAQMEEDLAAESVDLARRQERVHKNKWESGQISELERDSASLKTLEAEMRLANAVAARKEQSRRYRLALGIPLQVDHSEQRELLTDDPRMIDLNVFRELLDVPQPDIFKAKAEVDAAIAQERAQRAEYYPRVDFFLRYNQIGRDDEQLSDALANHSRQDRIVGIRLQWNLFNGLQSMFRLERAQADLNVAQLRADQEEANKLRAIQERRARIAARQNDVVLAEKRVDLAKLEARIARTQSESRLISEQQYRSKEFSVKEATTQVVIARIELIMTQLLLILDEAYLK